MSDSLDEAVERFRRAQPAQPSLTSVAQSALAAYVSGEGLAVSGDTVTTRILRHRPEIRRIVAEYGGSNPRLFGSVARGEATADSDVDLLIDLEPGRTLFDLAAMRARLEAALDTDVDIVTSGGLHGSAADEVMADALAL